jgi:hypothetical protein
MITQNAATSGSFPSTEGSITIQSIQLVSGGTGEPVSVPDLLFTEDRAWKLRAGVKHFPRPLGNWFGYRHHNRLGVRFLRPDKEQIEVLLPEPVEIAEGDDPVRAFRERVNVSLERPIYEFTDAELKGRWWESDRFPKWRIGSQEGISDDYRAILTVFGQRHGFVFNSGVAIFWLASETRTYRAKLRIASLDCVLKGSFWEARHVINEELPTILSELEPALLARNLPVGFGSRHLKTKLKRDPDDGLCEYRATAFDEEPIQSVIFVNGEDSGGSDVGLAQRTYDDLQLLSAELRRRPG